MNEQPYKLHKIDENGDFWYIGTAGLKYLTNRLIIRLEE